MSAVKSTWKEMIKDSAYELYFQKIQSCYIVKLTGEPMDKRQGSEVQDAPHSCYFCQPRNQEIRIILKAAFHRMRFLNENSRKKQKRQFSGLEVAPLMALQRMLKMLFDRYQFELKLSQECRHLVLLNLFRAKLRLSSQEISTLIEDFCDLLARRNYELQVIATQIKNVEESVVMMDQTSELLSEKRETTVNEVKEVVEVKVEEDFKPPFQDGTPQTGTAIDMAHGEPSFQYGMLLYGSMFFP